MSEPRFWFGRRPRREPRCGRGGCRFAFRHIGRCAMTPLGRACLETEQRAAEELERGLFFADRPQSVAEIVGLGNALLVRLRSPA